VNSTPLTSAYSVAGPGSSVRFNNVVPLGAGNILLSNGASVIAGYAANQTLLSRINTASNGSLLLAADSNSNLNFAAATNGNSLINVSLGAIGEVIYRGQIFASADGIYKLGGGGGTLSLMRSSGSLTGNASLRVSGPGIVSLMGTNSYTGGTTVTGGGTLRIAGANNLGSAPISPTFLTLNNGTLQAGASTVNLSGITLSATERSTRTATG
jgi:autotransporter-associated beta strand protein